MRVKFGPWTPDQPDLDSGGLEECTNCMPLEAGYTAIRSDTTLSGSTTMSFVSGSMVVADSTGGYMFVGCQFNRGLHRLFLAPYTGAGATPNVTSTNVGRTASYTSSTSAWAFTRYGNTILAANGHDAMQVGSISTNFRDQSASASAPFSKCLATVRDFVFAGNITSGGVGAGANRVQWCQINNPLRWTPSPRLQSDFQDLPDTGDILAMTGGDFAAILTQNAVWRATYVGSPIIFRFDQVAPAVRCLAPATVARYQNMTFFLSQTGFQLFDGQQCIPIGSKMVDKYALAFCERVAGQTVLGTQNTMRGIIDVINKLYVVLIRDRELNIQLLLYNFITGQWSMVDLGASLSTEAPTITESLMLAASFSGAPDLTIFHYTTDRRLGIGYYAGPSSSTMTLKEFFGQTFKTATFTTGEVQLFSDRRGFVTGVRPLVQGNSSTTITAQMGVRDRLVDSVSYTTATSMGSTGVCPQRVNARYHRVRVNVAGGFERAIGFDLDARPEGRR